MLGVDKILTEIKGATSSPLYIDDSLERQLWFLLYVDHGKKMLSTRLLRLTSVFIL